VALNPAVFIDKDGTLIHDVPYNVDPQYVRLREDAGEALARLQHNGYRLILVSNQSGIALGLFDPEALDAVWARIAVALSDYGVVLDAIYHCPHHPEATVEAYRHPDPPLRKPNPGMLLQAIAEWPVDVARSLMVGDKEADMEAARRAGVRGLKFSGGDLWEFLKDEIR